MTIPDVITPPPTDPVAMVEEFFRMFELNKGDFLYLTKIQKIAASGTPRSLDVNLNHVMMYDPTMGHDVLENPGELTRKWDQGFVNILHDSSAGKIKLDSDAYHVRFGGFENHITSIRNIRNADIGKMVAIRGVLVRATNVLPEIKVAYYECLICQAVHQTPQFTPSLEPPEICNIGGCKNKAKKKFLLKDSRSEWIDWQEVTIQERADDPGSTSTPKSIRVILKHELADPHRVGNKVSVLGVVKCYSTPQNKVYERVFTMYLDANNLISENIADEGDVILNQADLDAIINISQLPDLHQRIYDSLAPNVFGCLNIKKGLALQLFGGVGKLRGVHKIRGNIHILLMGDPSTAKSQLTRAILRLAPHAKLAIGNMATGAGLLAAVLHDEVTGSLVLDAGALVLADNGVAIIDEFDKMAPSLQTILNEVMEQETSTVAKAGINVTLNARTSLLASANPRWGRYDPNKTPSENINMNPTLLTRFDLIFFLIDKADETKDTNIASHIFNLHCEPTSMPAGPTSISTLIAPDMLRKYIHYARSEIHPIIEPSLRNKVVSFYVSKRKSQKEDAPVAVVARTLEGIIRLSEAHAKMSLRKIVNDTDVDEAIKIFNECQADICFDPETNTFDVDRLQLGHSTSKTKKMKGLHDMILEIQKTTGDARVTDIIERAGFAPLNLPANEVVDLIEALKKAAQLIEKKKDHYQAI